MVNTVPKETGGVAMSDEITPVESKEEAPQEEENAAISEKLAAKFRLIEGEEVLLTKSPSVFGFLGMYFLGLVVLLIHLLFGHTRTIINTEEASTLVNIVVILIELGGEALPIGFVTLMLGITWLNRMINVNTSGRWVTIWLLLVSLAPVLITIDQFVVAIYNVFAEEANHMSAFIGIDYDFTIFGVVFVTIFWAMTAYYQRSFHYAITSDAVIYQHSFFLTRSHRRILYDRISEVIEERGPVGTMLGFATITVLTDSGIGIVDESVSTGVGSGIPGTDESAGDTAAEAVTKSFLRRFFGLIMFQRTIKTVRPDPKHCFYQISNFKKTKKLLNEKHKEHSSSSLLADLKDSLASKSE